MLTMESTLSTAIGVSKLTGAQSVRNQLALLNFHRITVGTAKAELRRLKFGAASAGPLLFGLRNVGRGGAGTGGLSLVRYRLACISNSAASFSTGSGGGGGVFGGSGGGCGGNGSGDGGDVKANPAGVGGDDASAISSDVIILDVGGMSCGGCSASVKRILESLPLVSSASVNLTTETAIVWPVSEAKATPNWQRVLGEELAKHLTTCGFKSNLRGYKDPSGSGWPAYKNLCMMCSPVIEMIWCWLPSQLCALSSGDDTSLTR